ncbi:alpha/beta hydrolase [Leucobacter sp. NPDC077196]|uniref:alpha/beta fold hydrolase n=1 Tax=Leucobacter sp. NPDC077196 TaxID=3154959 RepID=UPI003434846B
MSEAAATSPDSATSPNSATAEDTEPGENTDEFRFLASDAARVGQSDPLPTVSRVRAELPDHRTVSGLAFDGEHAPALVAMHGAGLNAHSFDPMLLALRQPALALDMPGHGRSDWRADADYRPETLAADVLAALDRFAPPPVTLVGHSLGGLTAALVAASRPDLVSQVILIDITPGVSPARDTGSVRDFIQGQRDFGSIDEIVTRAQRFGIGRDAAALRRGIALNTRRRPDGRLEWTHHLAHLDAGAPSAESADAQPYAPIWEALASLEALGVPVALIAAESGMATTGRIEEWRIRLPHSAVVTVAGPHNLHEAAPAPLARTIEALTATAPDRTAPNA